jgi:hypothetical protein
MVLDSLGYVNNVDFVKNLSNKVVIDVFIICQKLQHVQLI